MGRPARERDLAVADCKRDKLAAHEAGHVVAVCVKLGPDGVKACLKEGVKDLGGTMMNETIKRAAGASHGQETPPEEMEEIILSMGRTPMQRNTNYGPGNDLQRQKSFGAKVLNEPEYNSAKRYERKRRTGNKDLVRPGLDGDERISSADII